MVSDISNEAGLENLITDAAYAAKLQRDKGIIKLNNYVIHVSVKFFLLLYTCINDYKFTILHCFTIS